MTHKNIAKRTERVGVIASLPSIIPAFQTHAAISSKIEMAQLAELEMLVRSDPSSYDTLMTALHELGVARKFDNILGDKTTGLVGEIDDGSLKESILDIPDVHENTIIHFMDSDKTEAVNNVVGDHVLNMLDDEIIKFNQTMDGMQNGPFSFYSDITGANDTVRDLASSMGPETALLGAASVLAIGLAAYKMFKGLGIALDKENSAKTRVTAGAGALLLAGVIGLTVMAGLGLGPAALALGPLAKIGAVLAGSLMVGMAKKFNKSPSSENANDKAQLENPATP